ncbi:unnamed protein product [Mucor hiemalis]
MHIPPLSKVAITLLLTANSLSRIVEANVNVLSWDQAYDKAKELVNKMSLDQKVSITTGSGWEKGRCVDSPLGIRMADNITSGVSGINAAASFDKKQIRARGVYMGQENRGKGVNVQLGPAMNFMRSPEGGRGWESGGEDPYLTGVLAAETVEGIQSQGVIATAKHFLLNDQELNRWTSSSVADSRTLQEIYLWPFARSVEAGVGSIMCSYNLVNGTHACENDYLLNTILKGELGFKGFVHSDWGATHSTANSANGGLDMTMPGDIVLGTGNSYFGSNLTNAVKNNEVPETRITDMATRIVATWYKMGQDKSFPKTTLDSFHLDKAPVVNVQADHKKLVREMGAASNVLLKNVKNTLPLSPKKVKKIAIIGSDAGPDPKGLNSCDDHGCSSGLTEAFGNNVKIESNLNDWDLEAAAETAKGSDYAFVFSNSNSGEEYIIVDGNKGDRNNISLWNNGDNLIKAVADANKNTIVVIHAVGATLMPWIGHPNIKAVLWPGLPGQESGNSLADIVTGKVNPSGRLPYTIAKKASDYNVKPDPSDVINYSEKLLMGYKWFDHANIEPLFSFGHGLSYTKFVYSNLKVSSADKKAKNIKVIATISVKNTGPVDGAEVVQAYLSFPESAGEPPPPQSSAWL